MRRISRRPAGFTLIEVIVALTLVAALMVGLMGALGTFGNTGARLEKRAMESDDMRLVHYFLRQSLTAASARQHIRTSDSARTVWLLGGPESLEWLGLMPARHGIGGLNHLQLFRTMDGNQEVLMLAYLPYAGEEVEPDWGNARSHILLAGEGVGLDIAYLRLGGEAWEAAWEDPEVLPGHVMLRMSRDGIVWPELIVRVLAAEPGTDVNQTLGTRR